MPLHMRQHPYLVYEESGVLKGVRLPSPKKQTKIKKRATQLDMKLLDGHCFRSGGLAPIGWNALI
jgi:hypothetical protein